MKSLIVCLISGLFPLIMMAQWYPLDNIQKNKTAPVVQILSDDNSSTVIKVDISGFELKKLFTGDKLYQPVDLLTEVSTTLAGSPEVPYIAKILAVPDKSGVSVEVIETSGVQTFGNIYLPPSRESWFEGQPESIYSEDKNAYISSDIYPANLVSIGTPIVFRDFRIVRLAVYPVRYIASKKELQVVTSITLKISYPPENIVNPKTSPSKPIAPSFAKIYESFIFNYKSALTKFKKDTIGKDVMLCILPDAFVDDFQPFADWKRKSGIDIIITRFSDIGATSTNPIIIYDHIANVYHNSMYPPTYVLLVGDYGICPRKQVSYDYTFANEDYFVEIDGNDFFPELFIGRFPVQNVYDLQVMVKKVINYEKTPYTTNTEWFTKGLCCSNNDYWGQVQTKRDVAHYMIDDGGFTSVDTLMSNTPCTMTLNDVIHVINGGRSFVNYRGEGWYYGWRANCYHFYTQNVPSLANGEMLPFFTSIGCGVAMFDTPYGDCFGEQLVKLGTPTSLRGAIAFIGAASNSHTQYNDQIDRGIYIGMFHEGMDTPGQALLRGKLRMYHIFGNDPWVEYQYRLFCILGDPSVHIWKEIPLAINVNHPVSVPLNYSENQITVTYSSTGLPVDSAQVTITGKSVFVSGYTDSAGVVTLGITPVLLDSLDITVRGGDVLPYLGKIGVNNSSVPKETVGTKFGIGNVFPNPFDQSTVINYSIPEPGDVSLKIYDISGRLIKTLQAGKQLAGNYSVKWNGKDDSGNPVSAGMYFIQLSSSGINQSIKLYKEKVIQK